jgi:hypothetical protein
VALVLALVASAAVTAVRQSAAPQQRQPESLFAAEFARLVRELSELRRKSLSAKVLRLVSWPRASTTSQLIPVTEN